MIYPVNMIYAHYYQQQQKQQESKMKRRKKVRQAIKFTIHFKDTNFYEVQKNAMLTIENNSFI